MWLVLRGTYNERGDFLIADRAFSQTARGTNCPKGHFFAAQSAKKPRFFYDDNKPLR